MGHRSGFFKATKPAGTSIFNGSVKFLKGVTPAASAEVHAVDYANTLTMASSSGAVACNIAATTAGTAGAWACGIFAKITQGSTKNVNGYLNAAEFELNTSAANSSDFCVMALNSIATGSKPSHPAFIYIRDYGTLGYNNNLLWFGPEVTIGNNSDTALITTTADDTLVTDHAIKFMAGDTNLWILCSSATPSSS